MPSTSCPRLRALCNPSVTDDMTEPLNELQMRVLTSPRTAPDLAFPFRHSSHLVARCLLGRQAYIHSTYIDHMFARRDGLHTYLVELH